jgi:hypothetical protein
MLTHLESAGKVPRSRKCGRTDADLDRPGVIVTLIETLLACELGVCCNSGHRWDGFESSPSECGRNSPYSMKSGALANRSDAPWSQ